MKIALDFDGTFTEDPELWAMFVFDAKLRGHEVRFVTFRKADRPQGNEDVLTMAAALQIEVIFTGGEQKALCWSADVWIDDAPELIPTPVQEEAVAAIRQRVLDNDTAAYEGKKETAP